MNVQPPRWIDRLLTWYCNPDLLEEIQGDAYELYEQRVHRQGRTIANWKYLWDVIRFCRWSNMRSQDNDFRPGFMEVLLNLNFKIAWRSATQHKLIFSIKIAGLAICLAFTTALIAFTISEATFDRHIKEYKSIYRIGSRIESNGTETDYAASPLALSEALFEEAPQVESAVRLMRTYRPQVSIGDAKYYGKVIYSADSDALRFFDFTIIHGTAQALAQPDQIVLTESTAKVFFGGENAVGKSVVFNESQMEVTAVIADPSPRSHLQFDALISWSSFEHGSRWDDLNAFTYVKIREGASQEQLTKSIVSITKNYLELIIAEYELKYKPIIQRIDEIHLSPPMEEDLADRGQKSNLYILLSVIVLFLVTGIINYLNITLAELTTSIRKFTLLKIFGGVAADGYKVAITDALLSFAAVIPLTFLFIYLFLAMAQSTFGIALDNAVWSHPFMIAFIVGFPVVMMIASWINALFISRTTDIAQSLKGEVKIRSGSWSLRQYLVAGQLSFSVVMIALMAVIVDQFKFIKESDKGLQSDQVMVISPPVYGDDKTETFMESLRGMAGVDKVDGCSYSPGGHTETKYFFELESKDGMKKELMNFMNMGYDYVDMLGIKVLRGRGFDPEYETDEMSGYLINETAAKQFGWTNPIGKRINGPLETDGREGEVIGVLKDFHYSSLHNKIEPLIIFINKNWGAEFMYIKLKPVHPAGITSMIEDKYHKAFSGAPMNWNYLDARYMALYKEDNKVRNIFEVGLVVSLILSSLGIFSISALLLVKRRKEMGIRKVVGASRAQLVIIHLRTFMVFLTGAILVAAPVIYFLSNHWLKNFAYHIEFNAWYLLFPAVITLVVILLSTGVHAIKSSLINPADVLKQE